MTIAALTRARAATRGSGESTVRALLQRLFLFPLVGWFCRPLVVRGEIPAGPVVFAANHASHADTAVLLRALPPRVRARTSPAAAADYWFAGRVRAAIARFVIGAFPFPRHGREGLARAHAQLARGTNVVLFPEGTRSCDGSIGRFKPGVGILAADGAVVVPVAITGTCAVFAKGARLPRRAPVTVTFGDPIVVRDAEPARAASTIEAAVRSLAAAAEPGRPRRSWYARARSFAKTRAALVLTFCWGVAEALWFPIVPDVAIALLALAAPARAIPLAAASIAGSLSGGAAAYAIGPAVLDHVPLVTDRMREAADVWLRDEGARGVMRQPWSGVPFKTFAYQAAGNDVGILPFLAHTFLARGLRFVQVGIVFAVAGRLGRRIADRAYGLVALTSLAVFAVGLVRVVGAWS